MDHLRPHSFVLESPRLRLRPLTEDDWDVLLPWNNDPDVLYFADGSDTPGYTLAQVQDIYRSVSERAFCFMIEHEGRPIGDCWLQQMNLRRLLMLHPDEQLWRIDIMIGEKSLWGRGLGTEAIRLLTDFGFREQGADRVYACGVADYNPRSQAAFRRVGYTVEQVITEPPGSKGKLSYDLCLTRADTLATRGA
jgi:RimJ/RimL family protein N-acetyltransferase